MSQPESGAAEQMVGFGIRALESISRLTASGAKNLAAFLAAWAKSSRKNRGRTTLGRMLRDGKELKVFQIDRSRIKEFAREAKRHGVLFTAIRDRKMPGNQIDIMVRAEDASKINRIIEKMNLATRDVATVQTQPAQENPTKARNGRSFLPRSKPRQSVRFSVNNELTGATESKVVELRPSVRATIKQIRRLRDESRARMAGEQVLAPPVPLAPPFPPIPTPPVFQQRQEMNTPLPIPRNRITRTNTDELSREIAALIARLQGVLAQIEHQPVQSERPGTTQPMPSPSERTDFARLPNGTGERDASRSQSNGTRVADNPISGQRPSARRGIDDIRASRANAASATPTLPARTPRLRPITKGR